MEEGMVGFEFRPYEHELVGFYLRNQIEGNTRLVERAITEVNFYNFDPWNLPFQSKIKSRDPVWYFSCKYANGNRQSRRTSSGFWKLTGESVDVKDQWGIWSPVRGKIGHKRCLVFLKGRGSEKTSTDWVMHEFHYDLLPEHERTYVICRLEYKGDMNILLGYPTDPTPTFVANATNSEGSVVDRSFQENSGSFYCPSEYDSANQGQQFGIFNVQQEVPYSDSYVDNSQRIWDYVVANNFEFLVDERTMMQTNRSNHCPKTPVTGVLTDDNSDSETDSMTCRDTSSSTDSGGSSNEPDHTLADDISSLNTIIEPFHNYEARGQQKQPKLQSQGKQKVINTQKSECEWKMAEDSIKKTPSNNTAKHNWIVLEEMSHRNSQWNYLKNMIAGFALIISIIGWIIVG